MPDLNLDLNYPDHPKTRRLIAILGPDADILPIRLWLYCGKIHPKDGSLKGYTEAEIEGLMKWSGNPSHAVQALTKVGFLKRTRNGYLCVDWLDHQGHLEAFSRRAKVAAKARWAKYATSMPEALLNGKPSNAPSVPTKPTVKKVKKEFVVPTTQEVSDYCVERSNGISGQYFIDFYQTRGWKLKGGQPIKDWKACIRTWENNSKPKRNSDMYD